MTYLDPGNDFIAVGTETDWRDEPPSDRRSDRRWKLIDEIEYSPSTEGFPLPNPVAEHSTLRTAAFGKSTRSSSCRTSGTSQRRRSFNSKGHTG